MSSIGGKILISAFEWFNTLRDIKLSISPYAEVAYVSRKGIQYPNIYNPVLGYPICPLLFTSLHPISLWITGI